MKIELSHGKYDRLSDIAAGETFYYKDELYIKTMNNYVSEASKDIKAVVRLSDGFIRHLFDEDFVIKADAKIVVE